MRSSEGAKGAKGAKSAKGAVPMVLCQRCTGVSDMKLRDEQGMSFVEATIILAVLSVLSAVLAPTIRDYIDDSQQARARRDVAALATSMNRMLVDIGEPFFLRDGNGTLATDPPSRATTNRVEMLVGDGNIPAVAASIDRTMGSTDWDDALNSTTVWSFYDQLIGNAAGYRGASDMSDTTEFDPDSGSGANSEFAWRGAYLAPLIGPDPWGQRYEANVEFLGRANATTPSQNNVFVISAGPNARMDTAFAATTPTFASDGWDDILTPVAGGRR